MIFFVGGFDQIITADHLRTVFTTFGPIVDITLSSVGSSSKTYLNYFCMVKLFK
jgi:RNA recognition motif-containing protein